LYHLQKLQYNNPLTFASFHSTNLIHNTFPFHFRSCKSCIYNPLYGYEDFAVSYVTNIADNNTSTLHETETCKELSKFLNDNSQDFATVASTYSHLRLPPFHAAEEAIAFNQESKGNFNNLDTATLPNTTATVAGASTLSITSPRNVPRGKPTHFKHLMSSNTTRQQISVQLTSDDNDIDIEDVQNIEEEEENNEYMNEEDEDDDDDNNQNGNDNATDEEDNDNNNSSVNNDNEEDRNDKTEHNDEENSDNNDNATDDNTSDDSDNKSDKETNDNDNDNSKDSKKKMSAKKSTSTKSRQHKSSESITGKGKKKDNKTDNAEEEVPFRRWDKTCPLTPKRKRGESDSTSESESEIKVLYKSRVRKGNLLPTKSKSANNPTPSTSRGYTREKQEHKKKKTSEKNQKQPERRKTKRKKEVQRRLSYFVDNDLGVTFDKKQIVNYITSQVKQKNVLASLSYKDAVPDKFYIVQRSNKAGMPIWKDQPEWQNNLGGGRDSLYTKINDQLTRVDKCDNEHYLGTDYMKPIEERTKVLKEQIIYAKTHAFYRKQCRCIKVRTIHIHKGPVCETASNYLFVHLDGVHCSH